LGCAALKISRSENASVVALRGGAQLVFDKQLHRFPAFSGDEPIAIDELFD